MATALLHAATLAPTNGADDAADRDLITGRLPGGNAPWFLYGETKEITLFERSPFECIRSGRKFAGVHHVTRIEWTGIRPGSSTVSVYNEALLVFLWDESNLQTLIASQLVRPSESVRLGWPGLDHPSALVKEDRGKKHFVFFRLTF